MRPSLALLSVELLALLDNLPGASSLRAVGGAPHVPTVKRFPFPLEKPALQDTSILRCLVEGINPDNTFVKWFHHDKGSLVNYTSKPLQETKSWKPLFTYSTLLVNNQDWSNGRTFTCELGPRELSALTTQKATGKSMGKPSTSKKSTFRSRFLQAEYEPEPSISCILEGTRPAGVTLKWRNNTMPFSDDYLYTGESEDPPYTYITITFYSDVWKSGGIYSCTVGQQGPSIQPTWNTSEKTQGQ